MPTSASVVLSFIQNLTFIPVHTLRNVAFQGDPVLGSTLLSWKQFGKTLMLLIMRPDPSKAALFPHL